MLNKKAIELSINFLVIIILSLAMLGLGIQMMRSFFTQSVQMHQELSEREAAMIESMLDRGEKVAISINSKIITRGDVDTFGLGILNVLDSTEKFTIAYTVVANDINNIVIPDPGQKIKIILENSEIDLKPNDREKINIFAKVDKEAEKGNYVYTVVVSRGSEVYGRARFIVVVA